MNSFHERSDRRLHGRTLAVEVGTVNDASLGREIRVEMCSELFRAARRDAMPSVDLVGGDAQAFADDMARSNWGCRAAPRPAIVELWPRRGAITACGSP